MESLWLWSSSEMRSDSFQNTWRRNEATNFAKSFHTIDNIKIGKILAFTVIYMTFDEITWNVYENWCADPLYAWFVCTEMKIFNFLLSSNYKSYFTKITILVLKFICIFPVNVQKTRCMKPLDIV